MDPSTADPHGQSGTPWQNRVLGTLPLLMVLGIFGLLARHSLTDLDIWFHLRAGRDLLSGAGFSRVNTYSFTDPNFPWLNHEWLFQILAAWTAPKAPWTTDLASGWNGLRLVLILALGVILLLGDGNLDRLRRGNSALRPALSSLFTFAGTLLLWPRFNLRPELVSYIFLVLLVRETERYYRSAAPARVWRCTSIWRLFAIIVLWAQCHGFAALGPVIVLAGIILRPRQSSANEAARGGSPWSVATLWTPFLLGVMALCLTPNLWHGLLLPLRALKQLSGGPVDLSRTVSELVPFLQTRNSLGLTMLAFKISLGWVVVYSVLGWGRISLLRLLLVVSAAAAALTNQRNIALYGLTFILLHTGSIHSWPASRWHGKWRLRAASPKAALAGAAAVAIVVTLACVWWGNTIVSNDFYLQEGVGRRFGTGYTPAIYPRVAAEALSGPQADRTFANLDAAAFLLGTTEAQLFIDGRTEAYPQRRWAQYVQMKNAGVRTSQLLGQLGATAVVLNLGSGAFNEMATSLQAAPNWQITAAGAGGILWTPTTAAVGPQANNTLLEAARSILTTTEPDPTRRADLCLAAAGLQELAHDSSAAERSLRTGLAVRPEHPALNHNLGNRLMAAGRFSAAAPYFTQAVNSNGRLAGSVLNLGVCQLRTQQPQAAVKSFRRSLAIDPGQVAGWLNLAVALRTNGQADQAIIALEKALALRPGDIRLQSRLQNWRRSLPQ